MLKEVGSNAMEQGVKDADLVKKRWFQGISKRPKFKSKHKSKNSFYVNYEILKRVQNGFKGEKIGIVKTCNLSQNLKREKSIQTLIFHSVANSGFYQ